MFSYTVRCTFEDESVAKEWIEWLRNEHLAEVLAAGALDGELIRFDPSPADAPGTRACCEARYHFSSREAFAAYERDHAPRLRAEGLKRFPSQRGIVYSRSTGVREA